MTHPLYNFPGGLNSHPLLKKQYRPIATATGFPCFSLELDVRYVRSRSPRMMTSAWITVLPPSMMFVVPIIWERRETLLPVSWWNCQLGLVAKGWRIWEGFWRAFRRSKWGKWGKNLRFQCTRPWPAFWTWLLHDKVELLD